jgi:hypothetical protein
MSADALDPLIHNRGRLRVVATLAALPDGARAFEGLAELVSVLHGVPS